MSVERVSSLQNALSKLLDNIRNAISARCSKFPLYSFKEVFWPQTQSYKIVQLEPFTLTTGSLSKLTRILEIILICQQNLNTGKFVTKRNLFYKLQSFYRKYGGIDSDLRLICYNLAQILQSNCVNRVELGIVPSNRCIMSGQIKIQTDEKIITSESTIITLPTCRKIKAKSKVSQVLIVQKESFFYQVVNAARNGKWSQQMLIISAKGYPDQNTRQLLLQLRQQKDPEVSQFFYLGDFDMYGFDIFLFYCFGDWSCKGLFDKIHLLPLCNYFKQMFSPQMEKYIQQGFTKEEIKKGKQIKERLQQINSKSDNNQQMTKKLHNISSIFDKLVREGKKCELQLLSEHCLTPNWLYEIICQQIESTYK